MEVLLGTIIAVLIGIGYTLDSKLGSANKTLENIERAMDHIESLLEDQEAS